MIKKINKIVAIILTFIIIITLFSILYSNSNVQADSYRYTYDGGNLDTGAYPRI